MLSRRRFLGLLAVPVLARPLHGSTATVRQNDVSSNPILATLEPVISGARHVRFHEEKVREGA